MQPIQQTHKPLHIVARHAIYSLYAISLAEERKKLLFILLCSNIRIYSSLLLKKHHVVAFIKTNKTHPQHTQILFYNFHLQENTGLNTCFPTAGVTFQDNGQHKK